MLALAAESNQNFRSHCAPRSPLFRSYCLSLRNEGFLALADHFRHIRLDAIVEDLLLHNCPQQARIGSVDVFVKFLLEIAYLIDGHVVEHAAGAGKDDQNLFREWLRRELLLLQYLDKPLAAVELRLRSLIEITAKLG